MKLTLDWIDWIKTNIDLGCTPEDLIKKMMENGYKFDLACSIVTYIHQNKQTPLINNSSEILAQFSPIKATTAIHLNNTSKQNTANKIEIDQHSIQVTMRLNTPKIIVYNHVLTAKECDQIIVLSKKKMQQSKVVDPQTGQHVINSNRTSQGTHFDRCENELFTKIDHRLAQLMNTPLERGEGCQILKYGIGGEYRPHYDYFDPGKKGGADIIAQSGQRISTLIIYLNDVEEGGATEFPALGIHVMPKKGSAVYFEYYNIETQTLDPQTLHAGLPVIKGEKWIMTKWVRERAY